MGKTSAIAYCLSLIMFLTSCSNVNTPSDSTPQDGVTPIVENEDFLWSEIVDEETYILSNCNILHTPIFLGFNGANIYFADSSPESFICYKYSLSDSEPTIIWRSNPGINIIDSFATAAGLYLIEFSFTDKGAVRTSLRAISENADNSTVTICETSKIPQITIFNYCLYIYSQEHKEGYIYTKISAFDISRCALKTIDNRRCAQNEDGTLNGDMILYCGGSGGCASERESHILYYQAVNLNGETLETGGRTTLYCLDVQNEIQYAQKNELRSLERKLLYFSGNENFFLASEYFYDPPFALSEKLYTFEDPKGKKWSQYIIPEIIAPRYVYNCSYLGDGVISFYDGVDIYFADIYNKSIQKFTTGQLLFAPKKYGKNVAYAAYDNGAITLCVFSLPGDMPASPLPYEYYDFYKEPNVELEGRSISFLDMPENDAEKVTAMDFLYSVTGDIDKKANIFADIPQHHIIIENEKKQFSDGLSKPTYIIHNIATLENRQYNQEYLPDGEYNPLYYFGWQKQIAKYGLVDFEIVNVEFSRHNFQYGDGGDGRFSGNFLLGTTYSDNRYKIYDFGAQIKKL